MADEASIIAGQRVFGCELIQRMGILLRLPQIAVTTAQVSFHRFYAKRSMRKFDVRHYAMGALFLATKVEECPRKMRDVLSVFMHLEQKRKRLTPQPVDIYSNRYISYKERLIKAEREILKELGALRLHASVARASDHQFLLITLWRPMMWSCSHQASYCTRSTRTNSSSRTHS